MNMELFEFMQLLNKAIMKENEEKLWQQWLVERPYMEPFISFQNYKKRVFGNKTGNNSNIDKEKAIEEAEKIKKIDQRGGSS